MELHVVAATEALGKGVVLDLQLRDLKGRKRSRVSASPRHILGQRDRGWHTQGRWHGRGNAACRSSSHPSAQALTALNDGPFPGMLHRKNISCQQPVASPACPIAHMWDSHTHFSLEKICFLTVPTLILVLGQKGLCCSEKQGWKLGQNKSQRVFLYQCAGKKTKTSPLRACTLIVTLWVFQSSSVCSMCHPAPYLAALQGLIT